MARLKIEGMSCGHCVSAVREALAAVPGVHQVTEVSLERGEAIIEGEADLPALIAAVQEQGYEAHEA
jgi:copper chaperone